MATLPIGSIIIWKGGVVPAGWAVCDGNNGTPNLKDKFIIGAGGTYALNATGGTAQHKHTHGGTVQKPNHSHGTSSINVDHGDSEKATVPDPPITAMADPDHGHGITSPSVIDDGAHTHTIPTSLDGSTIPEYITRIYIMRIS